MKKQEEIADKTKKLIVNTEYDPKDPRKRYKKAVMHRTLLLGVKYDGVDWEPYNVVLHTVPFKECNTGIEYLRQFWANFWPYLSNLIQDWEKVQHSYWEGVEEQDKLLKTSAEYIHQNKMMQLFMKEHKLDTLYKIWEEKVNASITKKSKR